MCIGVCVYVCVQVTQWNLSNLDTIESALILVLAEKHRKMAFGSERCLYVRDVLI